MTEKSAADRVLELLGEVERMSQPIDREKLVATVGAELVRHSYTLARQVKELESELERLRPTDNEGLEGTVAIQRDCWSCDEPVPMLDRNGNDISPDECPTCGTNNPCGDGEDD